MMIAAIAALALQGAPAVPPEVQAATQAWAQCITAPLARPAAGRTAEQIAGAALGSCAREQAALRVFLVTRFGDERGNREMDAFVERSRQRLLGALREIAAQGR
jgi:hypothetical protein